jgi:hypothetical protein
VTDAARPRRAAFAGLVGVAALGGAPAPAQGQVTLSLDVGAATVAYDEFLRSVVGTVTPQVLLERGRATFLARTAYSRFESGNESIQGTLAGSVLSPAVWKLRGELGATASTTRYKDFSAATDVRAVGRLHLAEATRGSWLGLAAGGVAQKSEFPDDIVQAELGGWTRAGGSMFTVQVVPTRVGPIKYVDALAGWRWLGPDGDLTVSAGFRAGEDSSAGVNRWAEVNVTAWLSRRVAVVGGVGAFPAEVVRGLPGGRYGSVALRMASRRPTGSDPKLVAQLILPYELRGLRRRGTARAEEFVVAAADNGTRDIHVRVPEASRVELMADFTDWTPVALTRERGGRWSLNIFIAPGVHRVNLRVDGGPWLPPPGLTAVQDEFGGAVGLLVVQ